MTDYEKEAEDFLARHNIKFKATLGVTKCPLWCDSKHIHGDHYRISFKAPDRKSFNLSFWNSFNDARAGKTPTAYGVLTCIQKYDPGDYEEFCSEMCYEQDSRRALKTYSLVVKEWEKVRDFFSEEELEEIQEIN